MQKLENQITVADVFDALGSDRVYKKAWEMMKRYLNYLEMKEVNTLILK
jgi:HD-GYP domain-containing protein (c-di-GMP phosphodiesterase class II)